MARQKMGPHRRAVTRMLRATGLLHMPAEAPLVELVKALADEMDARPGARTRADYLSALKDIRRVIAVRDAAERARVEALLAAEVSRVGAESQGVDGDAGGRSVADFNKFRENKQIG